MRPFAISPDEQRYIAERTDFSIVVLGEMGQEIVSIPKEQEHLTYVYTTLFTRDHSRFITSSRDDNTVRVWETSTGRELMRLDGHTALVICTALSRDESKLVTGSADGVAKVWDLSNGECLSSFRDSERDMIFSGFSPDGKRVVSSTASPTRQGMIWDAATGRELRSLNEGVHTNYNLSADFSADGKMVAISGGMFANVFDADTGHLISVLRGHSGRVISVQFGADASHVLTASNDNTVRVWNLDSLSRPSVYGSKTDRLTDAELISDGGSLIAYSDGGLVNIFDLGTGKIRLVVDPEAIKPVNPHGTAATITNADFVPVATTARDGTVIVLNSANGALIMKFDRAMAGASPIVISFTHDGRFAVTGSAEGAVLIWDLLTEQPTAAICIKGPRIDQIIISPIDDRLITLTRGRDCRCWDMHSGKLVGILRPARNIQSIVFSHDGKRIVTTSEDPMAVIWNSTTAALTGYLAVRHAAVHSAEFSPDDSRIVLSCQDDLAEVWDVRTANKLSTLRGHEGCVLTASYSPDGTRILTSSQDGTARIWDAESSRELFALRGHGAPVVKAGFSKDGAKVLTVSADGIARVWDSVSAETQAVTGAANDKSSIESAARKWN